MQVLRIGSSKGSEVARRLNACEDNILQKEMYRFQKEHDMLMKQFYNERYTVRQSMYDLMMGKEKNNITNGAGGKGRKPAADSEPRKIRLDRRTSHRNNLCTQYNTQKNGTISPPQDCGHKTRNSRSRVRSLSVPNISVRMTEAGQGISRNSFDSRPGQFDLNANRVKVSSTATHGKIKKTCRWMTDSDNKDEDRNMKESVNGIKNLRIDSNHCSVGDKYETTIQQRQRSRSEAIEIYRNNITKQETEPLNIKTPVRPKTSQATRRCSSRSCRPIKDGVDQESVTLKTTEIKNRGLTRGGITRIQNETYTLCNTISSRPLSSSPVAARFLCVSEAVLAAQKLIKSYHRQQAIEKATEELQAKRKHSSSMMTTEKTRANEHLKPSKMVEQQTGNRFKRAANLVMAANAFRRVAADEQKNKHGFKIKDGRAGQD